MNSKNMVQACLLMLSISTLSTSALAVPASDARSPRVGEGRREPADALLGRWRLPNEEIVVELTRSGPRYLGTVVASPKHPQLVGKTLFRGLVYDEAHSIWRGEVLSVKKSEYVGASIRFDGGGAFVLTAGSGLFTKDIRWTRAQ